MPGSRKRPTAGTRKARAVRSRQAGRVAEPSTRRWGATAEKSVFTGNLADALRDLRRRLSGDPTRPISQQHFSNLLGVSWSTVARWESGGRPDPAMLQKLDRLRRVLDALGEMVWPEHRLPFLLKENQLLLKMRPVDLLNTEPGAEAVIRVMDGTKSGAFA